MSVLSFNYASLKDMDAFQEYVANVGNLMKAANAEMVIRTKYAKSLLGQSKGNG